MDNTSPMNDNLKSLSGAPIYRHTEQTPWSPPQGEEFIEQISQHIESCIGPVESVLHEVISDTVHIDVHIAKPSQQNPWVRLITSGMSDLPMQIPEGAPVARFKELMISLPPTWRLDKDSPNDERWYWPIRLLKYLARMPHKYKTWLGTGHTIPNGDPSSPYAANTKLCGAIILPSVTTSAAFRNLKISGVKEIEFSSVVPLYEAEMNLKLRSGVDELLKRLSRHNLSDVVDPNRVDSTTKRFGFW